MMIFKQQRDRKERQRAQKELNQWAWDRIHKDKERAKEWDGFDHVLKFGITDFTHMVEPRAQLELCQWIESVKRPHKGPILYAKHSNWDDRQQAYGGWLIALNMAGRAQK